MLSPSLRTLATVFSLCASYVSANVTVYATTGSAAASMPTQCIGAVPCDGSVLTPVTPQSLQTQISTTVPVQLYTGGMNGLSITVNGYFLGFSLELSVANNLCMFNSSFLVLFLVPKPSVYLVGNDGDHINPIFLNLMSTIARRSGQVYCRVGGNTQELATVVPEGLPNGTAIEKPQIGSDRVSFLFLYFMDDHLRFFKTFTPTLLISPTLIYAMGNISNLVPVKWFLGVPFNDTENPRTLLAEIAQKTLGDNLLGLQLGNEPDLYHNNDLRNTSYTPDEYTVEWGEVLQDYINDQSITNNSQFIAPSVCCGDSIGWKPEDVWNTGFLTDYAQHLSYLSVQQCVTYVINCLDML